MYYRHSVEYFHALQLLQARNMEQTAEDDNQDVTWMFISDKDFLHY